MYTYIHTKLTSSPRRLVKNSPVSIICKYTNMCMYIYDCNTCIQMKSIHHWLLVPPVEALPYKYKHVYTCIWMFMHDSFHWKCHIPEIRQIQKLRFLGISRYKFTLRFRFHLNQYREIWVSGSLYHFPGVGGAPRCHTGEMFHMSECTFCMRIDFMTMPCMTSSYVYINRMGIDSAKKLCIRRSLLTCMRNQRCTRSWQRGLPCHAGYVRRVCDLCV